MDDEVRLESGKLLLFRRNGIWQARLPVGNRKYLWKNLKTSNEAEAKRSGLKLFHQTQYKLDEGLPVQLRSFSDVIDEYISDRERDNKIGNDAKRGSSIRHTSDSMLRQIKRVSNFWKEYAGKRAVEAVMVKQRRGRYELCITELRIVVWAQTLQAAFDEVDARVGKIFEIAGIVDALEEVPPPRRLPPLRARFLCPEAP